MAWKDIPVGRGQFKRIRRRKLKNPETHDEMFELLLSTLFTEVLRDMSVKDDFMDKKFSMRDLRYAYLRLKGASKAEAYRGAGYAPTKNRRQINAKENHPVVREIMFTVLAKGMLDATLPPNELVNRMLEAIEAIPEPLAKYRALMDLAKEAGYGLRPLEIIADVEKHAGGMDEVIRKMMATPQNGTPQLVGNVGQPENNRPEAEAGGGTDAEGSGIWPESGGASVAHSTKQRGHHISTAIESLDLEGRATEERSRVPEPPVIDDERSVASGGEGESA